MGGEPRLGELAQIYASYQERLQAEGWADRAGLGWLALEALEQRAPTVAQDWYLLVVDGFDSFTSVQLDMLGVLAERVGEMLVTLTGVLEGAERSLTHRRFNQTRGRLESALSVQAAPLPRQQGHHAAALTHLEAGMFRRNAGRVAGRGVVELVAAPDRAAEVRAALRWLKSRILEDEMQPDELALLARSLGPYRSLVLQTAAEFGLPVRLLGGLPLRSNPVITALLDLLRLVLPTADQETELALPRRLVIESWRSPYFDWSALPRKGATEPIGIGPEDADMLDAVARRGRIISGRSQWDEVLGALAALPDADDRAAQPERDEERGLPAGVPTGSKAQALREKFLRFVLRLEPPPGEHTYREFVGWLEGLIGPDPTLVSSRFPAPGEPDALQVVSCARNSLETCDRDVAALQALKDILRALVWAEEALDMDQAVTFPRFFEELVGAVDAASYQLPPHPEREEILVADVIQARGVPFRAVAVMGLAEGEFPATIAEDPFLRDTDRGQLCEAFDLPLEASTESAEAEYFYETVTRPRERLLLIRPRLADNGALWQASPYWEEVRKLIDIEPQMLFSESLPPPGRAASWPELLECLAGHDGYGALLKWAHQAQPDRLAGWEAAVEVLHLRHPGTSNLYDGYLGTLSGDFMLRFAPGHTWSASRLESYRVCPFLFFVQNVLALTPREEPSEGLDARQLGNIYHRILENVHQAASVKGPASLEQLLAALPEVAAGVLDCAPQEEGFRETAWWNETREEIIENIRQSLAALDKLAGDFTPVAHEAAFGLGDQPELVVKDGDDLFRLRGFIDRIDRAPDGSIRVIDYKTAGPYAYRKRDVEKGKKLQLPLYALAARDALAQGEPVEGFYWHVRHAEHSQFTMSGFQDGPEGAMEIAVEKAWEAVRGARDGHFVPNPPDDGCPSYCPAAGFCWHCRPGFGG
jgi:RecB family exonuclease/superfamily I DNA/RNA helicase